jgi:anti-sigma regulatory factor (Ser/Thr protein kinase)
MSQLALAIAESSQVGDARRQAAAMAEGLGFEASACGTVALAITETATNIVKHAGNGKILLRPILRDGATGIELIALDGGPGIANIGESLRDGHSTAGSPGLGLGTLFRAGTDLQIYSQPGLGTVLRCEIWARAPAGGGDPVDIGAVCVAKSGEVVSGDDWVLISDKDRHTVMVVDGLGHGPDAAAAARAATAALAREPQGTPAELLEAVHHALKSTRGAAAGIAVMQPGRGLVTYSGVGNIVARIHHEGKTRNLVSHNGILGSQVRKIQEFSCPFPASALLVMHSDGLATYWDFEQYPGLGSKHPGVIAGVLYRDHQRSRDDATVAVFRNSLAR